MKVQDSGMPEEQLWEEFFSPNHVLTQLGFTDSRADVLEFGCGYGTFTIPVAHLTSGRVFAMDIEPAMLKTTAERAQALELTNVITIQRDLVTEGTGLEDASVSFVMLFNILHADDPISLLQEAHRVLRPEGKAGVIHWIYDPATPRGPDLSIRPRPEQCQAWLQAAGFELTIPFVNLPPYHFGLVGCKR